jgi:cell division protein ZapA (FtsZ GTPase activity inhibitor)
MEKNRADVVICGANYVLSSDKSEERIKEIAKMVDEELRATSKALNVNPNYKAAVLTALNIAEKLMDNTDMTLKLQTENYQLDNDVKHYIQLWEQSKKQVTDLKDKMSSEVDRQTQNSEDQKKLQDKLVEKEYLSAKLYYDLGAYAMNCAYGGSNYEACVVTAQNALRDFPFASADRREELSIMILRSRYNLAEQSVESKRISRYRDCIDEYYSFVNDFPESKYIKEAEKIMQKSTDFVKKHASQEEELFY